MQVFIMMPLRHTPTVDRLRDVMGRVAQLDEAHQGHAILLDKFRRQTLRRLQVSVPHVSAITSLSAL
jgi:hypothetical protein